MSSTQSSTTTASSTAASPASHTPLTNHNHIHTATHHNINNNHSSHGNSSAHHLTNDQNSSPTKNRLNNLKHSLNSAISSQTAVSGCLSGTTVNNEQETTFNPKRIRLSESIENINNSLATSSTSTNNHPLNGITSIQSTENSQKSQDHPSSFASANNNNIIEKDDTILNSNNQSATNSHSGQTNNSNGMSNSSASNSNMSNSSNNNNHSNGSGNSGNHENNDIDESLYSRQLYVLGHDAMRRMQASNVLIVGLGGLGLEIAKNVTLGGVKSITLHDSQNITLEDLSTHYFATENDVGKNRAQCSHPHLAELNTYVPVKVLDPNRELTTVDLKSFQVVVLTQIQNTSKLIEFGKYCHDNSIKLIVAQTRGIFGQIFCDFGENFEVVDIDGEQPLSAMISAINNDQQGIVTTLDEQRHGFEDDMVVTFSEVKGMDNINGKEFKIKVFGPYTFGIGDTQSFPKYLRGGYVHQVKKPKMLQFKSLDQAIRAPEVVISDFCKMEDSNTIHLAFLTVCEYENKHQGQLPRPWNSDDANEFIAIANQLNESVYKFESISEYVLRLFSYTLVGQLTPLQAVIGGNAAQEVMKACSGKFMPINQYFYFDCRECLPEKPLIEKVNPADHVVNPNETSLLRYKSQIAIFGKEFQQKLGKSKWFLVGAGALGCEYLKNFAMMGLGTREQNGKVIVTDMDTIEKSNLNRQFLFRSHDVQKCKSTVAADAALRMNPHLNVEAHTNRVGPDTESVYNDKFFENLDGVCNALDNIDARVYMDRRCVYYHKPLIESGTLGTKGNVQVVIPFLTESYSSTQDPPEKSIPICTLKNFPNAIEHTLQWARDMFEGVFTNPATSSLDFLKEPDAYIQRVLKLQGSQPLEELQQVYKALVEEKPKSFEDCVSWARLHWQENYHNNIEQLLYNFPKDQLTSSGVPFWSGPKRCPHSLTFSTDNQTYLDYVYSAANLKAEMYGIAQVRDKNKVIQVIKGVPVSEFKPKQGIKIHVNDSEAQNASASANYEQEHLDNIIKSLKETSTFTNVKITPIEFEKDDDSNLHMDFIVSCSNLRAENYDITPADRHKSKLIAGRIIPAIATTTSLIVGLDCIELFKLIQGHNKIEIYKSSFVNLALPFFGLSEPMPPKKSKYYDKEFSLWDRFEVNGEMTLKEYLEYFKTEHSLEITMLSQGVTMLYAFFMDKKKLSERLNMTISSIVESISKKEIPSHVRALVLEICCNDNDGNDLEVPYVKYNLPKI